MSLKDLIDHAIMEKIERERPDADAYEEYKGFEGIKITLRLDVINSYHLDRLQKDLFPDLNRTRLARELLLNAISDAIKHANLEQDMDEMMNGVREWVAENDLKRPGKDSPPES